MKLLPKQEHAVYYLKDTETVELIYGGAAGGGKSAIGCLWLIENCQKYPGTRWLMGRSKLKNLKETTLKTFFELGSKLKVSDQYKYKSQEGLILWDNKSEIILKDLFHYPSDQEFDSLGSLEITGAFVDECNQIVKKAWDIAKSRCRFKLDEFDLLPKILGTCNPSKNWVYTNFYKPHSEGTLPGKKKFIQALPKDNPHLHPTYIEILLELDENSKKRLHDGDWDYDDDPMTMFHYDKLLNSYEAQYVVGGNKYMTCDIAMQGSDLFVVGIWDEWRCEKIYTKKKCTGKEIEEFLRDKMKEHKIPASNVCFDADGMGSYLSGYFKSAYSFHGGAKCLKKDKKDQNYKNLRAQCYYYLAEMYDANNLLVLATDEQQEKISEELGATKKKPVEPDKPLEIISKKDIQKKIARSPDYADMLMMRSVFDLDYKKAPIRLHGRPAHLR